MADWNFQASLPNERKTGVWMSLLNTRALSPLRDSCLKSYRNPYALKLLEVKQSASSDDEIYLKKDNWLQFFKNRMQEDPNKLIFEIGCSNSAYLRRIAKKNKNTAFVGMDWKYKVLYLGAEKILKESLNNIYLLRGKAQEIDKIFGKNEIDEIWIFYPDPWAKKRQQKNRLLQAEFLKQCFECLSGKGKIFIKTDHPGYFQWIIAHFGIELKNLPNYEYIDTGEKGMQFKQMKVRKLATVDELPQKNLELEKLFKIGRYSLNYWIDQNHALDLFSNEKTLFEEGFLKQNLPIYFLELIKK